MLRQLRLQKQRNKKNALWGVFYFLAETNKAKSHPMIDQPKSHEAERTRIASYFSRLFAAARQTGVKSIPMNTKTTTMYFAIYKMSDRDTIQIPYFAELPNSSSIRINWLYLAIRSVRDIEPVLICPAFVATAKSAIVVSSVSPLR